MPGTPGHTSERMTALTRIMQDRLVGLFCMMAAMGVNENLAPANDLLYDAAEQVLAPDRDRFACPLRQVTRVLRLLTSSGSHELISVESQLTAEQIVSIVLDGLLAR